jgi:hypothetical protein
MGQRARADARQKFCANDIIPIYEAFYQKVLEGEPQKSRSRDA